MKKQPTFFSEPNKPILDALYRPVRGHDRKRKYVPRKRLNASSLNSAPASSARAGTSTVRRGSSTATLSNLFDGGLQKQTSVLGSKIERLARLRRVLGFQSISATVMGMGDIYIQPNCKHCIAHMRITHGEHGQITAYCPVCNTELKIEKVRK